MMQLPAAYCTACGRKIGCFVLAPRILDRAAWRYVDTPHAGRYHIAHAATGLWRLVVSRRVTTGRQKIEDAWLRAYCKMQRRAKSPFLFIFASYTFFNCSYTLASWGPLRAEVAILPFFLDRVLELAFVHGIRSGNRGTVSPPFFIDPAIYLVFQFWYSLVPHHYTPLTHPACLPHCANLDRHDGLGLYISNRATR